MRPPRKVIASIAIILITLGIAIPIGYQYWMCTRTFVALDMPVSLSSGYVKTPDFEINLEGWYEIWINTRDQTSGHDCRYTPSDVSLAADYTVHRDGHELAHSGGEYQYLGHFFADRKGRYGLDIRFLSDITCLNSRQPSLTVWTSSNHYEYLSDWLRASSAFLFLGGLGILVFSIAGHVGTQGTAEGEAAISENAGCAYYPSRRKLPLRPRFSRPPAFGFVYSVVVASVLMPSCLIFIYAWGFDYRSVGIQVQLSNTELHRGTDDFFRPPLIVRLEKATPGSPPRLYLNARPIAWEALGLSLRSELKSRAEWIVYFETDRSVEWTDDVDWGDVANAMDIARGLGARVAFLPKELKPSPINQSRKRKRK
jgi:hypothetical protein